MKIILAVIATLILSQPAVAADRQELCTMAGSVAEVVMTKRQDGVPMSTLMGIAGDQTGLAYKIITTTIIEAYKRPRYSSYEYRRREIADFRNFAELECYK